MKSLNLQVTTFCPSSQKGSSSPREANVYYTCRIFPYYSTVAYVDLECEQNNMVQGKLAHIRQLSSSLASKPIPYPFAAMPRMILLVTKGGMSGKTRKRYAVRQKLQVLEDCCRLQKEHNLSSRTQPIL